MKFTAIITTDYLHNMKQKAVFEPESLDTGALQAGYFAK
jgi:hypothetical protein